jgi:hypothetical protein
MAINFLFIKIAFESIGFPTDYSDIARNITKVIIYGSQSHNTLPTPITQFRVKG